MDSVDAILSSTSTAKAREVALLSLIRGSGELLGRLIERFPTASGSNKGTMMAALESLSRQLPNEVLPYAGFVIDHLEDPQPRVRWEAARVIGNLAGTRAMSLRSAVPALLGNARHTGTVVRWSAAFALTELAMADESLGKELLPQLRGLLRQETGNGVRKMYEETLKQLASTPAAARQPRKSSH
jgi:hypothetical protein